MWLSLKWAYEDDPVAFPAFLFLGLGMPAIGLVTALAVKGLIVLGWVALVVLAVWGTAAGAAWLNLQWQDRGWIRK